MQDFMWAELKRFGDIDRNDRATWSNPWRGLNNSNRHGVFKGINNQFVRSHPWLTELTGVTSNSADRLRDLMNQETIIDGVPVRVVELTGEPDDVVLCHGAIYHARSFNYSDTPRFMRTQGVVKTFDKDGHHVAEGT